MDEIKCYYYDYYYYYYEASELAAAVKISRCYLSKVIVASNDTHHITRYGN